MRTSTEGTHELARADGGCGRVTSSAIWKAISITAARPRGELLDLPLPQDVRGGHRRDRGRVRRRRRLSLAAAELASGEEKVIDLALRCGYESPDAFAKAFKREFGVTPSEARSGGVRLKTWPRLGFSVVLKGDVPMEYRIEKRGEIPWPAFPSPPRWTRAPT
jgi:AraC-like DNA-binding protein